MERLHLCDVNWTELDAFPDRTVFQTFPWLTFVANTQRAEPVVAAICNGHETVGYFTGLIVRKLGLRILGSPFPGWTTSYMGFNLQPDISRKEALQALEEFAFSQLRCAHLEIMDRQVTMNDSPENEFRSDMVTSFEIDLRQSEERLWAAMKKKGCRWCIQKAEKSGVVIEEAHDLAFAEDYYNQLREVFGKQSLVPTYDLQRVRELLRCLLPTGMVLLLRARDPSGICIATGIFPAMNRSMHFWGGASWRQYQILRPNEAIQWYAMRYWKKRGIQFYDMGGVGDYKRKYGGYEIAVPWFRKSRYPALSIMRNAAKGLFKLSQSVSGLFVRKPLKQEAAEEMDAVRRPSKRGAK